ncbi:MAG: STAS domain-containing protein, partial [Chlamydiae bacterium]|nr:STAS domain-containing protein [Chlamydiota bacterium]
KFELEEVDQVIVLRLDGRLDAPSAPILERKVNSLIEEKHYFLALDFSKIDYLSSAGMRVLLSMNKKIHAKQGSLILFSVNPEVEEVLKMAGFDRVLHLVSSEKEALQFNKK